MLFDYLVVGQVMPANPAHAVKTERLVVRSGKTPLLTAGETRMPFDAIDTETIMGKRDTAIIGTLHKSQ